MRAILRAAFTATLIVSMLGIVATSATAAAIPPVAATEASAAGKWNVDYGEWECRLSRDLVSGGKPAALTLTVWPLTSVAWMKIGLTGRANESEGDNAVMFIDGQRLLGTIHYNEFPAGKYRVLEFKLDTKQQDLGALHDRMRFWAGRAGDVEVQLDDFPAAWAALNKCLTDFNADLGITPANLAQVATPPDGEALSFVDFPRDPDTLDLALFFWVTADGKIENCRLIKPSGFKDFDGSVCKELEAKGRFKPARNAAGTPIPAPHFEHDVLRKETMTVAVP